MTRTRRTTMPTVPLAERIRAALTQGWHTLAALDDLTGPRGSKARAAVHEALRTIKASGAIVEEQSTSCGVAVRIVETAAGMPEDESGKWEPASDGATACNRSPCPDPCPGRGCECRAAQGFAFTSDDWCNCTCHYGVTTETTARAAVAPIPDAAPAILPRAKQRKTPGPIVDVAAGRIERVGDAAPRPAERCRPPVCYADDIHEPARVRGFALPLCAAHRAWVQRAGGSVAGEG